MNIPANDERVIADYCSVVTCFFPRGADLYHMLIPGTGARRYCEGMDVKCERGFPEPEELLKEFISLRMALLPEIFPDEDLQACAVRSSGHSHTQPS